MATDLYQALASVVLVDRRLEDVLGEISAVARDHLPGAVATSITLVRGERAWTAAYTGQLALDADEMQYEHGYGPCVDAGRSGLALTVHDMRTEERWPGYASGAVQAGVLSSLSVPLPFQGSSIGALNVYSNLAAAFDDDSARTADEMAAHIGIAVMNADAHAQAQELARQMQEALDSRKVIDMALGVLVAIHHCTPDEAFAILVRASQQHNRKLRDLARTLVEAETRPA